jgi:hypothetical protein
MHIMNFDQINSPIYPFLSAFSPHFGGTYWSLNSGPVLARQALYHLTTPPALFALVIFQIGSQIYETGLDWNPFIYVSYVAGVAGMCNHFQLRLI